MTHEIALFWLTVAGFLIADNLILAPRGCDVLRLGRRGVPWYETGSRLSIRGREATLLNPLNLFDRALLTTVCLGDVQPSQWRGARQMLRQAMPVLNTLALVGYAYMVLTAVLAWLSFQGPFLPILIAFGLLHLLVWFGAAAVVVLRRRQLRLSGMALTTSLLEALFVPAYLMNLGKRLLYKRQVAVSSLGLALRSAKRVADPDDRAILGHRLRERMDTVTLMHGLAFGDDAAPPRPGNDPSPHQRARQERWVSEAKACLTA